MSQISKHPTPSMTPPQKRKRVPLPLPLPPNGRSQMNQSQMMSEIAKGSSKVISEALPEPGIRNSSSRSSLQYQGPAAAAQCCAGHPEAVASTELQRRGVRSALTHYALQASAGVAP
uniref:Uncharacterized protein n=1 Tax=Rangifer tarandus platyrhynchus TaxID=3082113 RepID=A0ACB0E0D1_RANTA|nr:unnamed protein product [Rangifer tarandus platyrhynchus]